MCILVYLYIKWSNDGTALDVVSFFMLHIPFLYCSVTRSYPTFQV